MFISIKSRSYVPEELIPILTYCIEKSRFTANISLKYRTIKISIIRLKDSKPYHGCQPGKIHRSAPFLRKQKFLEGADWVDFNDFINDILDILGVSANVYTDLVHSRKGPERRINYGCERTSFSNYLWWEKKGKPEDYKNCIFKASPNSTFPKDTHGIYDRNVTNVKSYLETIQQNGMLEVW